MTASVEVMTRVHTGDLTTSQPGAGWGLGWFVIKDASGALSPLSPGTYGHGGRYGTFCFIDPHKDLIGIFMMASWGLADLLANRPIPRPALAGAVALLLGCLTMASASQVRYWQNSIALWRHALEVTTDNYRAHSNLGNALADQGKTPYLFTGLHPL